jgi:acetoacetyl-CoA synthetase
VAALVGTSVVAVVLFYAAASLGAVFTCVSPELGVAGCVARLRQVGPRVLFADEEGLYRGVRRGLRGKVGRIVAGLGGRGRGVRVVLVPVGGGEGGREEEEDGGGDEGRVEFETWGEFLEGARAEDRLEFTRVEPTHPLMICYSSGTSGEPKCIVHHHLLILQLRKIAQIHNGTTSQDVILQYSSTSWVVFYVMYVSNHPRSCM